jgi:hypothetical protein
MIRAVTLLIAIVALVGSNLGPAVAQPAPAAAAPAEAPPPDPVLVSAKADFEEAQTLYIKEAYNDAAAKFLAAYDKKPFGAFLFNAAVAFEKAKKYEQAMQFFEKYLEKDPDARDAKEVKERIEGIKALLAPPAASPQAAPKPEPVLPRIETKGLVIIDSKPSGAVVYLDDKKNGVFARTPWQGSLPPKSVKLIVESKGWKSEERVISPRTDKVYEVYIALSEEHFLGWIEVASNVAGADVFLDKREIGAIGRTPYTGHVKPGKHTVWLERPGYAVVRKDIDVAPGTATTHMINMEKVQNGWISVAGKQSRGGKLLVDGKPVCDTPCRHEVVPGRHEVEVTKKGFEEYEGEVEVGRSAETEVAVNFSPRPPRSGAWSAAAMSAVFFAGGIYAGTKGKSLKEDIQKDIDLGKPIDTGDPRGQRGKYWYIGANVAFGLGTITAAIATWNFLRSGPDSTAEIETKNVSFVPARDGRGGSLVTGGRF